jgi:hypothetical protein
MSGGAFQGSHRGLSPHPGPVRVGQLLDLVGAVGSTPNDLDAHVQKIYDWHHARGVSSVQLAFAPAAVAALTILAKGVSTAVIVAAAALLSLTLGIGVWRLIELTRFDREYVLALHLAKAFAPLHKQLGLWLDDEANTNLTSNGRSLRSELHGVRDITMVEYRSDQRARETVRNALERARLASAELGK